MEHKFRHLDLFSGIGGFALAASWVWGEQHEIVSFCEIEKFPQKVLKKHWPDVPIHDDIKTMKGDQYGRINLLTGGFPCQPYSTAGKQRGSKDARALWPEMFRIIKEAKPNWIIGENVAGFTNMGLDSSLSDMESEGYETTAFNIPACSFKANHERQRIWILGSNTKHMRSSEQKCQYKWPKIYNGSGPNGLVAWENLGSNPNKVRRIRVQQQHGIFQEKNKKGSYVTSSVGVSRRKNTNWEVWEAEPSVARVADGISSRLDRIRGIGNAIVPEIVAIIMAYIKQIERET